MKQIFHSMDYNMDGKLSMSEIKNGLINLGMPPERAEMQANRIFNEVKKDKSDLLEF